MLDTPHFTAFCPYASRFPFETWIVPKNHTSHYENIPKPGVDDLGHVLKTVLNKLELALDNPSYNYIIHTAPFDTQELPHYHWHIEIIPRLTRSPASSGAPASTSTRCRRSRRRRSSARSRCRPTGRRGRGFPGP